MVNPIFQQDEELLLNPFGSRYLASGVYTDVNSSEFVVQEDTVISLLTGGDASISENNIDYKTSMNLSGVTLKKGALIVAPVGEAFKSITIDSGAIMVYNCVVEGEKPASFVGLLDDYPDATAAYSLRKLRADYEGDAIRVRVDTTGQPTYDIGFDSNNELDTADLLSKAAGNSAYVDTWYDQSGAGNDATQATASRQPRIVKSGNLITDNGSVCVDYYSIYVRLLLNSTIAVKSSFSVSSYSNIRTVNYIYGDFVSKSGLIACGTGLNGLTAYSDPNVLEYGNSKIVDKQELQILTDDGVNNHIGVDNGTILSSARIGDIKMKCVGSRDTKDFSLDGKLTELITYPTDQTSNISDITNNINKNYNIYWDGSQTGLLDNYPNASAAYSLRALNSAYTGAAIRVRRTDNATQDIGLLYDGSLDTEFLLNFVGSGDGFIDTWYDQSGEGNDATQGSASAQPKIVSNGSLINENGKVSIQFDGINNYVQNQLSVSPTVTTFAVSRIVSQPDFHFIYDSATNGRRLRLGLWFTQEYFADNGDGLIVNATTASNGLQNLFFAKHTNSDVSISVNQDTLQTTSTTNFFGTTSYWNIGARNDGVDHFLEGTLQELILYPSDQDTNREAIETNINNYYTIY